MCSCKYSFTKSTKQINVHKQAHNRDNTEHNTETRLTFIHRHGVESILMQCFMFFQCVSTLRSIKIQSSFGIVCLLGGNCKESDERDIRVLPACDNSSIWLCSYMSQGPFVRDGTYIYLISMTAEALFFYWLSIFNETQYLKSGV